MPLQIPTAATVSITELIPVTKGTKFNEAVGPAADIFDPDLSPSRTPTSFRIYAAFDTAGVLTVRRTKAGDTVSEELNSGVALVKDGAYVFDIVVDTGETINLQHSVGATILYLIVLEVGAAVS